MIFKVLMHKGLFVDPSMLAKGEITYSTIPHLFAPNETIDSIIKKETSIEKMVLHLSKTKDTVLAMNDSLKYKDPEAYASLQKTITEIESYAEPIANFKRCIAECSLKEYQLIKVDSLCPQE